MSVVFWVGLLYLGITLGVITVVELRRAFR